MLPKSELPVLYSFRRCPYAIRARMAIAYAGLKVELREVLLKDKPPSMIAASQKGTVPVIILPDGKVIDESIDVMRWALNHADPEGWLGDRKDHSSESLIADNDGGFKRLLDKYKYADRHPEHPAHWYRDEACKFLAVLENHLEETPCLSGASKGFADVAIFPFIRQFAGVDRAWFDQAPYPHLRAWLDLLLQSSLFQRVMTKHVRWIPGQAPIVFPG